jgi:hypothetical protein
MVEGFCIFVAVAWLNFLIIYAETKVYFLCFMFIFVIGMNDVMVTPFLHHSNNQSHVSMSTGILMDLH